MGLINVVIIQGRLSYKPVLKRSRSGLNYTTFKIYNNKFSEQATPENPVISLPISYPINCIAYKRVSENIVRLLKKGDMVTIIGSLAFRKFYNAYGQLISEYYVLVREFSHIIKNEQLDLSKYKDEYDKEESTNIYEFIW